MPDGRVLYGAAAVVARRAAEEGRLRPPPPPPPAPALPFKLPDGRILYGAAAVVARRKREEEQARKSEERERKRLEKEAKQRRRLEEQKAILAVRRLVDRIGQRWFGGDPKEMAKYLTRYGQPEGWPMATRTMVIAWSRKGAGREGPEVAQRLAQFEQMLREKDKADRENRELLKTLISEGMRKGLVPRPKTHEKPFGVEHIGIEWSQGWGHRVLTTELIDELGEWFQSFGSRRKYHDWFGLVSLVRFAEKRDAFGVIYGKAKQVTDPKTGKVEELIVEHPVCATKQRDLHSVWHDIRGRLLGVLDEDYVSAVSSTILRNFQPLSPAQRRWRRILRERPPSAAQIAQRRRREQEREWFGARPGEAVTPMPEEGWTTLPSRPKPRRRTRRRRK